MRLSVPLFSTLLILSPLACDSKPVEPPKKTKSLSELEQEVKDTRTPEELEKARREAGFTDPAEEAKANMAAMEKGEREFVKTRLVKYREVTKSLRGHIDNVEKQAKAWATAKDAQKSFDKFVEDYKGDVTKFYTNYNELTENGIRGGALAASLGKALRSWEDINNDLSPEIAKEANFDKSLTDLRALVDEIDKEFDAIDKDDTLKVNPNADEDEPKEGAEAEAPKDGASDGAADDGG